MRSIKEINKIVSGDLVCMKNWLRNTPIDFFVVEKVEGDMLVLRFMGELYHHPNYKTKNFITFGRVEKRYPHLKPFLTIHS